jgi:hypothetical protein
MKRNIGIKPGSVIKEKVKVLAHERAINYVQHYGNQVNNTIPAK